MKTAPRPPAHADQIAPHMVPAAGPAQVDAPKWWQGLGQVDPADHGPIGGRAKRAFDVSLALTLLVGLAPMLLGLALLVRMSSPGPILFGHVRIGYRRRSFLCLKLRTMVVDGDAVLAAHFLRHPEARREWDETCKLRHDPRVTPLGHVLRKLSLDELPQLINVLRGDMSLVGPRPVPEGELRRYGRSLRYYLQARPGITGLWQVSGRNSTTYARRVAYDRLYVAQFSPAGDAMILIRTLPAALRARETS